MYINMIKNFIVDKPDLCWTVDAKEMRLPIEGIDQASLMIIDRKLSGEVGAEATGIKGEVSGKSNILGIITSEGKVSGAVGGVGVSTGGALIVDKTDYSLTVKASGKLAFVLGIGADVNIKTGCVTVLIGG